MVYRSVIKELDLAHFVTVFYWFEEEKKHCLTIKRVWCISTVSVYSVIKHVNYDKVKSYFLEVQLLQMYSCWTFLSLAFFLLANYYVTCFLYLHCTASSRTDIKLIEFVSNVWILPRTYKPWIMATPHYRLNDNE